MANFVRWNSQPIDAWREKHAIGKMISLDGLDTHYVDRGSGDPVILVHGFNMDLLTWIHNIDALAAHHRVLALDLWGLGFSTRQPLDYGYTVYARQLELFMDALDIPRATLIGHSMGSGTAITFTLAHPDRVEKLVMVDSTGVHLKMQMRAKFFNLPGVGEFLLRLNTDAIRRMNLEDYWVCDADCLTPDLFAQVTQFQKIEGSHHVLLDILRKEFFHTLDDAIRQLGDLEIPKLIVWGANDQAVPVSNGETMHRLLPGSRLEVFEGAGHMPNFEDPERFNALVLEFLQ